MPAAMRTLFFETTAVPPHIAVESASDNSDEDEAKVQLDAADANKQEPSHHLAFARLDVAWTRKKWMTWSRRGPTLPWFAGFRDKKQRSICRFASWCQARGGSGYLPCRRTLRWLHRFDLKTCMAMFGRVPDDNLWRNRSYPLLRALTTLIDKYNEECVAAGEPPDLIDPKTGRLWLILRSDLFYRHVLLRILHHVRHVTIFYGGLPPQRHVRAKSTRTMLIILLARISNDMFKGSFRELENTDNFMLESFKCAMGYGYYVLATIFSLFVDKRTVEEFCEFCCRKYPVTSRISRMAMWYMCKLRNIKCCEDSSFSIDDDEEDDDFNHSLATRALESAIRQYGLSSVLRLDLSANLKSAVHRYFYRAMWRYVGGGVQ